MAGLCCSLPRTSQACQQVPLPRPVPQPGQRHLGWRPPQRRAGAQVGLEDKLVQWPGCERPTPLLSRPPSESKSYQPTLGLVLNGGEAIGTSEDGTGSICSGVGLGGRWAASAAWARSPSLCFLGLLLLPPDRLPVFPRAAGFATSVHRFTLASPRPSLSPQSLSLPLSPAPAASLPPATLVGTFISFPAEAEARAR